MVWSIISWKNLQEIQKKAQNQPKSGKTGKINGALEPNLTRILKWDGGKSPRVSAVPI